MLLGFFFVLLCRAEDFKRIQAQPAQRRTCHDFMSHHKHNDERHMFFMIHFTNFPSFPKQNIFQNFFHSLICQASSTRSLIS